MSDTPRPKPNDAAGNPGLGIGSLGPPEDVVPPNNLLPLQLSSFVGREREVAEVGTLLSKHRLLTLTGPGGSGKTRLALAVASKAAQDFEDGAWLVELASLSDPELVPQAVARVLRVPEAPGRTLTEAIAEDLSELAILLVLDNCEHLIGACAELAEALLRACPGLAILATSREALNLAGEGNFPVPPLSLPDPGRRQDLERYEAVRLFVDRAREVFPGFGLTDANAPAVARVCRLLDGMPLAIELAAARTRVLSVEQISLRLEDSFALLAGGGRTALPRQRTLRAVVGWSHELLSEGERVLFRRLAVFAGGFTLEAAEGVCGGEGVEEADVLALLCRLVDKSMVVVAERDGAARYRLLEALKRYGRERLEGSGEVGPLEGRHAAYYLALAEGTEPEPRGEGLGRLERERANLRAALGRSVGGADADLGLRLAVALERSWWTSGHLGEGRRWLERALAESERAPAGLRARALNAAGWMALFQGDLERATELLEEGLACSKGLGDEPRVAASLTNLGHAALHRDDRERLEALREEAEELRRGFADPWAKAEVSDFLGMAALYEGEHGRAAALLGESAAAFRDLGDAQRAAVCATYLWMAALEGGNRGRATALIEEDLRESQGFGARPRVQLYDDLMGSAVLASLGGETARAARLWGAAEATREAVGLSLPIWEHTPTDFGVELDAARSRLGEEAFAAAWSEGRAMSAEEAVEYALGTEGDAPQDASASPLLSGREVEVLVLVAEGLTNPQVAQRLYLSPRTVGQHLRSVFRKLGVPSRAAAAREALERGLI